MIVSMRINGMVSETESATEAGAFNVVVDVFVGNGFLDDFLDAEGGVARGVEVLGRVVESAFPGPPAFEFANLNRWLSTILFLSCSATLTMWPKEGTTLMLMELTRLTGTHLRRRCSGRTSSTIY